MTNNQWNLDSCQAFAYHWKIWHLMGIKAPRNTSILAYQVYALLINTVVTLLFPLTLIVNVFLANNMQQLCENLTITITDTIANFKFINVYLVRRDLEDIKMILRKLDKRVNNQKEFNVVSSAVQTSLRAFLVFVRLYAIGTVLSIFKVLFSEERTLLYPAWFGVDWRSKNDVYCLVLSYQLFGLVVQALQNCANDSYPPAYLIVLTAHMKALELRVQSIGLPMTSENHLTELERKEMHLQELNACIRDYLNILRLYSIIQRIISKACLAQFLGSVLVQCTVGLHFLYVFDVADYGAQILSVIFFVAVTLEVYIICHFGHCMSSQSMQLTYAFYSCHWFGENKHLKKNLIITLLRTQRHLVIYAGSYIPVNLPTFVLLIKYAYSTFTLLIRFK